MGIFFRSKQKNKIPLLFVSDVRREYLITDITRNSAPSGMYYLLMGVASFIASIGLMADSPAVVIGAMLVSPLMTPIFGFSLGLVRGEFQLIRDSLFSVVAGILLAIGGACLLGSFPIFFELTNEIISRTKPNLLDLGVAAFAGIAGTVALIDEKVSPVMPGIAIATSLVPPLCASGLCLSLQQYNDAWGSFLLFFANFLMILSVASALFLITGFLPRSENEPLPRLVKHFSISTIGLIIVAGLLTRSLIDVSISRKIDNTLRTVSIQAIRTTPNTTIEKISHQICSGVINGFIVLQGPIPLHAEVVKKMETTATQLLHKPVRIIARTSLTQSVSSVARENINDLVTSYAEQNKVKLDKSALILEQAELLLRSIISEYPWYTLSGISYMNFDSGPGLIIEISGPERPMPAAVAKLENMLRKSTKSDNLALIIRYYKSNDITRNGRNLFGTNYSQSGSPEAKKIEKMTTQLINNIRNIFPIYVEAQKHGKVWQVMADITGARIITSKEIKSMEEKLSKHFATPVSVYIYSKTEAVVSGDGIKPLEFYSNKDHIEALDVK